MTKAFNAIKFFALLRSQYAIVIAETILLTLLTFGTFSVLVRLTDVKTIGLWVLINSLLSFSRMADFWSSGLVSFVAQSLGDGQREKAGRLVSTAMISSAVGYLLLIIVVWPIIHVFAGSIPGVEDKELVQKILPLMSLTFWLLSTANTYQVGFLGFNRPGYKVIQTVGGAALFLLFSIVFVPRLGLWGILVAQCVQAMLMLLFGFIGFHFGIAKNSGGVAWDKADFRQLAGYGSKATVVGVLQIATDPLIRLLVSSFGGLAAVTLVEVVTRIIVAVRGLILSVGQLLVPAFARASVEDEEVTTTLYREVCQIFVVVTVPTFAVLLCLSPIFEHAMLGASQPLFLPMLWLLCLGWGVNIASAPAYFLMTGRRNLRPLFWNRLTSLLFVAVLGSLGGWLFGVIGVTVGVSMSLIGHSLSFLFSVNRYYPSFGGQTPGRQHLLWVAPLVVAGAVSIICRMMETAGLGRAEVFAASLVGGAFALIVSIWVLPLRALWRKHIVRF
jgi:O-antigen/teichoic acid export membrane protein